MRAGELGRRCVRPTEPGSKQQMAIMVARGEVPKCCWRLFPGPKQAEPVVMIATDQISRPWPRNTNAVCACAMGDRRRGGKRVLEILDKHEVDFVVLARFRKILSPDFVWRYKNKIINIHPSLLPSFPGPQAYRQAYEHGVKIAGVTAHFVSMQLDEGPIIAQESFRIKSGTTLKQIVAAGQQCEPGVAQSGEIISPNDWTCTGAWSRKCSENSFLECERSAGRTEKGICRLGA